MSYPALTARGILFCGLLVLGFALPAAAQTYDVVGTILDDTRGDPLAGVEIKTQDGKHLGTSQSTGRFEITVNNRKAVVLFHRDGYKDLQINLGDLAFLVDVDISMESSVQELAEQTAVAAGRRIDPTQSQSIEELESMQGMRMDLNDHLRQLHGVAGMNEFTSDISVYGSRTQDVTHYLGKSRIPSLRHLDFGFPGNESVLNPRLLKSVTLADNLGKGPLNQGNASALVYDLQDGDPEAIHGDVVLGTVNREANFNGYWDDRTYTFSVRQLDPNSLGALGRQFFTTPRDARLNPGGTPCTGDCPHLTDPFTFSSGDLFFSTFRRDSTGAFSRHSLIVMGDDYTVSQDVSTDPSQSVGQKLVDGSQGAWLYSYESVTPSPTGDFEWGLSFLSRDYRDAYRDTLATTDELDNPYPWYPASGTSVDNRIGSGNRSDHDFILSMQWGAADKLFGALPSYGLELEYVRQSRVYTDISSGVSNAPRTINQDLMLANALYRLTWNLSGKRSVEASAGFLQAYDAPFKGDSGKGNFQVPLPMASVRYTQPLNDRHKVYIEVAGRQTVTLEPEGYDHIGYKTTPSMESKFGGDGMLWDSFRYAWSGYGRWYDKPQLPDPEVFWNYSETRVSDYAVVGGANGTLMYSSGHHFGSAINGSVIQGHYHMTDGSSLPWESNRTLDVVTNVRYMPRDDSLLSFIITYGIQNGAPLYEYRGLWDTTGAGAGPTQGRSTGQRAVYQNTQFPTVSRQRVDARINLDLKSHWRPLESMRFFFEADNLFSNFDGTYFSWLGGANERRRGWTRANPDGDLEPVVTRGLGLFIMFGLEGKLKI